MRIFVALLLILLAVESASGATFKGKVIDADTKQSIEGAAVVASWSEERATPTGPTTRLKDVKETLTDKNGMWLIEGPKGGEVGIIKAIFSFLTGMYFTNPPEFIVFKPGYCSWPAGFGIDACKEKIKPIGNDKIAERVTVELPRLTNREDRERNLPGTVGFSREFHKKQLNFLRLIDEEHYYLYGKKDYETYIKELQREK